MKHLIYPFHAAQKMHFVKECVQINQNVRAEFANKILNHFSCQEKIPYIAPVVNTEKLKEFMDIYGIEAVLLSLFLHPLHKKITLHENEIFGTWKLLNKIWTLLHQENKKSESLSVFFEIYEKNTQKLHLYFAAIAHIVKYEKNLSEDQKKELLRFLSPLLFILKNHFIFMQKINFTICK